MPLVVQISIFFFTHNYIIFQCLIVVVMLDQLAELEKRYKLGPLQRILLTTDGSITRTFEALTGGTVKIETVTQEVVAADEDLSARLGVDAEDKVNFRVINLKTDDRILVHATSFTPLSRLKPAFRKDIMKEDVPIGRILARLRIEARREIRDFGVIRADAGLADIFQVSLGAFLLRRNYDIIHNESVLMNITEVFPFDM